MHIAPPRGSVRSFLFLALSAGVAIGCGSSPSAPADTTTIADFTGSWSASSEVFTNNANPSQTYDLLAHGGVRNFTVLDGGRVRTWFDYDNLGTFHDEWDALATLDGNKVTMTPAETSRRTLTYTYTLDGNTLTLTDSNVLFVFPGSTDWVTATVHGVYQRYQ